MTIETFANGEIYFRPVACLPGGCTPIKPVGDHYIVGHSETGHHHVLDRTKCEVLAGPASQNPEGMAILYAIVREPTETGHLRDTDQHKPIAMQPGIYEIRPGREFSPEGWKRQLD